ncbi:hypothetical protein Bbelb_321050 [Branchiostoma belcheri]|nr:hypothetical protein Bbelb_321050 [Branchiostoma belcheri]
MPIGRTGFHHPVVMSLLTAATLVTVLWFILKEERKQKKERKDVPRKPRTMLIPKLSRRDDRSERLYDDEDDFETVVLEEWVDKYDGPSGAYTRRATFVPTESQSCPNLGQPRRPAAQQPRPRQPSRRPPLRSDPIAIRSATSVFGDAGFFAALRDMGQVYGEVHCAGDRSIVHRTESAEIPRAGKVQVHTSRRVEEEDIFYDVPGLSMWKIEEEEIFYDVIGLPMKLPEAEDTFYDAPGAPMWLPDVRPLSPVRGQQPVLVPVLEQRPLAALPRAVIPPAIIELMFAIQVLIFIFAHSQGGALRILVEPVQVMANRITQLIRRGPFYR